MLSLLYLDRDAGHVDVQWRHRAGGCVTPAGEESIVLGTSQGVGEDSRVESCYLQDDVERGLRTSLISVLTAALADEGASAEYLKGVFDLARRQASLYGVVWCDLLARLYDLPELRNLVLTLQESCREM
jgi:hypothetical protein